MKRTTQIIGALFFLTTIAAANAADTVSLAGHWRVFIGKTQPTTWIDSIRLPGTIDDAGLGPKNTKKASLQGPYRLHDYAGPVWYQRDIEIPGDWAGKRVTLFLERCRWVTTVWLDDKRIGSQDSLIAPHVYDFGTGVKPGKHRLTICVDNTVKLKLGVFVSALFGGTPGNMNGIIGRLELNATPPVWIDDVQVYPDAAKKSVRVVVKIGNATGKADRGTLSVGTLKREATWDEHGGITEVTVDMPSAKLWDEFSPNLTELTVELGEDSRTVRFGMRDFAEKGTQFTLNGRPLFLRGTLECSTWPLTGYPPTDIESWRRIYRIIKSYGLNFVRFHSWCPPDAAFTAADEEGVILQPEGPRANVNTGRNAAADAFTEAELMRIVHTYGNHPSFCLMTLGNEYYPIYGKGEQAKWVDMLIQDDPRHLYASQSGVPSPNSFASPNSEFAEGWFNVDNQFPGTMYDVRHKVALFKKPQTGHEIGQWLFFPDFNEVSKWTGVMALKNFELIRGDLKKKHMLDLAPQFVQASGKLGVLVYKGQIEMLLRTPGFAGLSLLGLHDYPTQGTAVVGILDPFWDSKGFITPDAWRRFCGPTVPLLRMPKRTYTTAEKFAATVDISHFGPADITGAEPTWKIQDQSGYEVASGKLPVITVPTGALTPLGAISASLADVKAPAKLTVTVSVGNFSNDWDIWVYPPVKPVDAPADIIVSRAWDDATKAELEAGKSVVLLPENINTEMSVRGRFMPQFWSPVWFPAGQRASSGAILCDPKHPALALFPTEFHSNWQWWDLLNNSRSVILDDTPATFHPIVQVIDNFVRNDKLGNLFEARIGSGKLLVCTIDLPRLVKTNPVANQLLRSLYAYAGSSAFQPATALDTALLDHMFLLKTSNTLQKLGAKIHADSEERRTRNSAEKGPPSPPPSASSGPR